MDTVARGLTKRGKSQIEISRKKRATGAQGVRKGNLSSKKSIFRELVEKPNEILEKKDIILNRLKNKATKERFLKKAVEVDAILHHDINEGTRYINHALHALLVLTRAQKIEKQEAKQVTEQIVENRHFFDLMHAVVTLRLMRAFIEESLINRELGSYVALSILNNNLHKTVGAIKDEALGLLEILYKKRLYHNDNIREKVRLAVERRAFGEV